MAFPLDSTAITHGIQLAVAPVFLLTSVSGMIGAVAGRLARVVDRATNARLEVSFFRPFWGDYWVIDLADDYGYAVVGHPSRDYLWILSRTPTLPADTYAGIVRRLQTQGYETARLVATEQPGPG